MKQTILIVDDEKDILKLIQYHLKKEGFNVTTASSGGEALDIIDSENNFELIILDIMLPGIDGIQICKRLKDNEKTKRIPVILLTAKSDEADIISGLKIGADDYITKPFSPKILIERVKTILRRCRLTETKTDSDDIVKAEEIEIDVSKYEVKIKGKLINLTNIEYNILLFFIKNRGKVFTREKIMENAWGQETVIMDRAVDVHINWLREKLGKFGELIETVRGVGYKFKEMD